MVAAAPRDDDNNDNNNNHKTNNHHSHAAASVDPVTVSVGPDLNGSKTPLDLKVYRQILLPNGLHCVLIQDTVALHQTQGTMMMMDDDDDDDMDDSDDDGDDNNNDTGEQQPEQPTDHTRSHPHHQKDEDDEDDNSDADEDDGDNAGGGVGGLRDAAAALVVGAGSAYDPPGCDGLAHFLEHLLFMGSTKYPGENEYESYVSKHGGSDNAFTEWEYTQFSLSIPHTHLWPALDRLAQHFVSPLLLESAVDRELRAIEAEFQLSRQSDGTRREQLLCSTARQHHFVHKFAWGNLQSLRNIPQKLGLNPLQELRTFFDSYYYAANMKLVVQGAYPLDHLQRRVTDIFAALPALPRTKGRFPLPVDPESITSWDALTNYQSPLRDMGPPWDLDDPPKVFRIVPVKEKHSLTITWPLPSLQDQWRSKPCDMVAHLLGHEGQGSLLSCWRARNWATGVYAGVGDEGVDCASSHWLLSVTVTLSQEGFQQWTRVVDTVYEYLGLLRWYTVHQSWPSWLLPELQQTQQMSYLYSDEPDPEDGVEDLVEDMAPHWRLPPDRLLDGSSLLFDMDESAVRHIVDALQPRTARIDLTSSTFGKYADLDLPNNKNNDDDDDDDGLVTTETTLSNCVVQGEEDGSFDPRDHPPQIEPMFQTAFWCTTVPPTLCERWNQLAQPTDPASLTHVALPVQNPFVPTRYNLKDLPARDSLHPLLNASLKVCVGVGKSQQWFPATVRQYNRTTHQLLLCYEDGEEQWHSVDAATDELRLENLTPDYQGTLDGKKTKFRILAVALPGSPGIPRMGDESDLAVEDGKKLPPIPLASPPSRLPKPIADSNTLRMFFLQDRIFRRPIADLRLQMICARANASPLHQACAELLVDLVVDTCLETAYLASVADLQSSLEASCLGFDLRVHGFDDKLVTLFTEIFAKLLSFGESGDRLPDGVTVDRYEACLEELRRGYRNSGMSASRLCRSMRLYAIRTNLWSAHQKVEALANVTIATFMQTVSSVLQNFSVECLLHGNVDEQDAKEVQNLILSLIKGKTNGLPRKKYPSRSILRIPLVQQHSMITVPSKDETEKNTAVEVYVQVGKDNLADRVMIDLLAHMMDEPFFDQVRTKDQFGYSVGCDVRWSYGIMGFMFRVVSNVKSCDAIVERIDAFLRQFQTDLDNMKSAEFMEHVVALSSQKLDMFNSMSEETGFYWEEIMNGRYQWEAWRDEALQLRSITHADVVASFKKWLDPDVPRMIMAIRVVGGGEGDVSQGRPSVSPENLASHIDGEIQEFQKQCKKQFWGKINSRLF